VNSGNGAGRYYPGADVVVTANDPSRRYVFDRWDGDREFLSNPLSPTTTFKMPDRNCLHHGALQARSKPISSRTKPCDGKLRRPYLRAPTIARRTHRWRKLRRNRSLGLHLLSSVRPETNPIVLLFADKPQDRRLVFLDAWITPDARIDEKVVVKVIVGRGDLANDALVREGPKLMIDAGD
jgi:Divergent InlB B-repeat domain